MLLLIRKYWFFIVLAVIVLFFARNVFFHGETRTETTLRDLAVAIQAGEVKSFEIRVGQIEATTAGGEVLLIGTGTLNPEGIREYLMETYGVTNEALEAVTITFVSPDPNWIGIFSSLLPVLLFGGLILFMMRRAQGGGGMGAGLDFGKSRARKLSGAHPTVTFDDIAGCQEAKEEMREVVEFLGQPEKFMALGARIPKGTILVGPPGCGKTLMARAVAGEANVPFFFMAGSEFMEMFVGVGASRVRDLFDQAKKNAPSIVFVDEIDAIGRMRGGPYSGSGQEQGQTLNQILTEMDGFEVGTNVVVLAATNRPDILDVALTRKGRFDRQVVLDRPDLNGREAIFDIHVRGKPLAEGINLHTLAAITPGFTGADIEATVNEAAILAARRSKTQIEMDDFREAIERVIAGPERRSKLVSDEEKNIIAHHEAGHALVMASLEHCDPVRKVSIIARGMALGYTFGTPEEDRWLIPKAKLLDDIAALLGGRAAEELMFAGDEDKVTTGAANDLERATELARQMVVRFGMSDLGLQAFVRSRQDYLRELFGETAMAQETARLVDVEVGKILAQAYKRAKTVLTENGNILKQIVAALRKKETLTEEEFNALVT